MTELQTPPALIAERAPAYRYAAYFAPAAESAWGMAGAHWLGRDAFRDAPLPQPVVAGLTSEEMRKLTGTPRRYGWHATLKAPFQLAADVNVEQLVALLRTLCRGMQPLVMPSLEVRRIDDFLALLPAGDEAQIARIHQVASVCVTGLQPLAQALSHEALERRRQAGLTAQEERYLLRWGYPYVLGRFRFHMTLSGSLHGVSDATVEQLRDAATAHFAHLPPCELDAVAVFTEPAPGADFVALQRLMLGA